MTLEMGCLVHVSTHAEVVVYDNFLLTPRLLPSVPMVATTIITGGLELIHATYGKMGLWVQNNGYRMIDKPREITLQATQSLRWTRPHHRDSVPCGVRARQRIDFNT